jgi:hypothetical protein
VADPKGRKPGGLTVAEQMAILQDQPGDRNVLVSIRKDSVKLFATRVFEQPYLHGVQVVIQHKIEDV